MIGLVCGIRAAEAPAKTRVLIVTGGHEFEKASFFKMFEENPKITVKAVEHPNAYEWFKPEHAGDYDVILLYDMCQNLPPEAQTNLLALLKSGKGLVALHHSLCSYQDWPEYEKIIGGKYHLAKWSDAAGEKPASTYKHGVDFMVKVSAAPHPVTRGLKDFAIHDETYGLTTVTADVLPLLSTDETTSGRTLAWAKSYEKARVVYCALGHDHTAYENPSLRQFIAQAIEWTVGK